MATTLQIQYALDNHPIVVAMGPNRQYVIGDTAYRFNLQPHQDPYITGHPVTWIDGKWIYSQLAKPIFVSVYREVTILEILEPIGV